MKTLIFGFLGSLFLAYQPNAGTAQLAADLRPQWFADTEWNLGVFGAYAFPHDEIRNDTLPRAVSLYRKELTRGYLNTDHAWGGGVDAKYLFRRYFGAGIEGDALDADGLVVNEHALGDILYAKSTHRERRAIRSVLVNFIYRYPIGCSRFAPYAFAGGAAIFGGGERSFHRERELGIRQAVIFTKQAGDRAESAGHFGGGMELRLTQHIGITTDFSWNVVNGRNNNFGMVRTEGQQSVTIAY